MRDAQEVEKDPREALSAEVVYSSKQIDEVVAALEPLKERKLSCGDSPIYTNIKKEDKGTVSK